ncbi:MAG TPA: cytochrome c peroxidase [Planctomycetota bacterium]|nr:cytochrome c peroxidase [Planctomycetota bacterium]
MIISRNSSLSLLLAIAVSASFADVSAAQGPPPPPPPPVAQAPAGNPVTAAKTNLGKVLFWEEQLGSNQTMACGTCHVMGAGGSDPRSGQPGSQSVHPGLDGLFGGPDDIVGSRGVTRAVADGSYDLAPLFRLQRQVTNRRAPSAINAAFAPRQFWDGRAQGPFTDPLSGLVILPLGASLEIQALGPPTSDVEMGHVGRNWNEVAARIQASVPLRLASNVPPALAGWINGRDYPSLFLEVFGTPDVTPVRIAMAIATYERTLSSNQTPFDAFVSGNQNALTPLEQQGLQVFNNIGRCIVCHGGPFQTDNNFHYTGVRPQNEDLGRFLVTGTPADRGAMKTPGLRNVELRAPYFHNGRMSTLSEVIDFYDRGGDFNAPNKALAVAPIGLNVQQKAALLAFLTRPLTDPRVANQTAPFDRPTLASETSAVPARYGAPTPGAGGFTPKMIAFEPAVTGTKWTVGIDGGNGGRPAVLLQSPVQLLVGLPFQGTSLHVDLASATLVKRVGALHGTGNGGGWSSASINIASDPLLIGQPIFSQWLVIDPLGGGLRMCSSEAIAMSYL